MKAAGDREIDNQPETSHGGKEKKKTLRDIGCTRNAQEMWKSRSGYVYRDFTVVTVRFLILHFVVMYTNNTLDNKDKSSTRCYIKIW